jgi:CHAD domain-containing protein
MRPSALTVDELCAKYDNECVHTEHVTALALQLFDRTHRWLKLPVIDRPLLEAACRLHDIGFSVDPGNHSQVSAQIVSREGLCGFTTAERIRIAEIIPLHAGDWRKTRASRRARQLGAILRVADGLDYSHVQDASIVSIRRAGRRVRVAVRCVAFPHNVARANQKADLWCAVQPVAIEFVPYPTRATSVIRSRVPIPEAARRLISVQFKTILVNVPGVIEGKSSEPLHDIRVAIRRLRLLLRVFRKSLPPTSAKRIDHTFSQLGKSLGPARDMDVWVEFLQRPAIANEMAGDERWQKFLAGQLARKDRQLSAVGRHLTGHRLASLRVTMGRFLRTELPRLTNAQLPERGLKQFSVKKLAKELRRVRRRAHFRHSTSPQKLHELRIVLRRARYLGEFLEPVLGRPDAILTQHLREVERPLGRVHDIDMALERIRRQRPLPPAPLLVLLGQRRRRHLKQLNRAWRQLAI